MVYMGSCFGIMCQMPNEQRYRRNIVAWNMQPGQNLHVHVQFVLYQHEMEENENFMLHIYFPHFRFLSYISKLKAILAQKTR